MVDVLEVEGGYSVAELAAEKIQTQARKSAVAERRRDS